MWQMQPVLQESRRCRWSTGELSSSGLCAGCLHLGGGERRFITPQRGADKPHLMKQAGQSCIKSCRAVSCCAIRAPPSSPAVGQWHSRRCASQGLFGCIPPSQVDGWGLTSTQTTARQLARRQNPRCRTWSVLRVIIVIIIPVSVTHHPITVKAI